MKFLFQSVVIVLCGSLMVACDDGENYAPVTEVSMIDPIPRSGTHRVTSGETLYEIAWRYGMDYRTLANNNHIQPPYTLKVGQVVYLRGKLNGTTAPSPRNLTVETTTTPSLRGSTAEFIAVKSPNKTVTVGSAVKPRIDEKIASKQDLREPSFSTSTWQWPAKGKIIRTFSGVNRGVNIAGNVGDAVYAAASGKVVYCGDGLRGYGNLIIIKHNSVYLSAYAHNSAVFVKEGAWVKQGQTIAEIGKSGTTRSMLHFEIRRAGKPIDPMPLLKA